MDGTNTIDPPAQPTDQPSEDDSHGFLQRALAILETRFWPDSLIARSGPDNFWPSQNSPDGQAIRSGKYNPRGPDHALAFEQPSGSGIKYRYADSNVRGFRNNNFGNISYSAFAREQDGYVGADGRFAQFASPEQGLRAMDALLTVYQDDHGLKTVEGIIGRWAPPNENNTSWYYTYVAKRMGLNSAQDIVTADKRAALISAIIQVECGYDPFGEDRIKQVLAGHNLNMDKVVAVGPQTRVLEVKRGENGAVENGDALLNLAAANDGKQEVANNRELREHFQKTLGMDVDPARTPWCAYYVNSELAEGGLPVLLDRDSHPTGWAYDFINYGKGVSLADARPGDIAVFAHHVGFFVRQENGMVIVRGGNQNDMVNDTAFSLDSVKAIRRPEFADNTHVVAARSPAKSPDPTTVAAPLVQTREAALPTAPSPGGQRITLKTDLPPAAAEERTAVAQAPPPATGDVARDKLSLAAAAQAPEEAANKNYKALVASVDPVNPKNGGSQRPAAQPGHSPAGPSTAVS